MSVFLFTVFWDSNLGVSTLRKAVSGEKKFFQESEDLAGNLEAWEIFWETQRNYVKLFCMLRFFGNVSQKFGTIFPIFLGELWHMVLLKTASVRAVTPCKACHYYPIKSRGQLPVGLWLDEISVKNGYTLGSLLLTVLFSHLIVQTLSLKLCSWILL